MTIEQTVEIPANGILHLDITLPTPHPIGKARLALAITPDGKESAQCLDKTLKKIRGLCKGSKLTVARFLEMRREDNEIEEKQYRKLFLKDGGES